MISLVCGAGKVRTQVIPFQYTSLKQTKLPPLSRWAPNVLSLLLILREEYLFMRFQKGYGGFVSALNMQDEDKELKLSSTVQMHKHAATSVDVHLDSFQGLSVGEDGYMSIFSLEGLKVSSKISILIV